MGKHSVLGLMLTFNIYTIRETLFFRCGIVIRIILNAYFLPPLSLPLCLFSKNLKALSKIESTPLDWGTVYIR